MSPTRRPLDDLLDLMRRLRAPEGGCPWDLEQTFATIAPYTIEEAYEVADAIERDDPAALQDELGDLLFQVVFHAQIAEDQGLFAFDDVARSIHAKMVRRHPHVFGDAEIADAAAQTEAWERHKAAERAGQRVLDGVPANLPALTRALKLQKRAARVGFDWAAARPILDKVAEEARELVDEMEAGAPPARLTDEMGDLLFVMVNLARHLGVDPETALRGTNAKFERRFRWMEDALASQGRAPDEADLDELEGLWAKAKGAEAKGG